MANPKVQARIGAMLLFNGVKKDDPILGEDQGALTVLKLSEIREWVALAGANAL